MMGRHDPNEGVDAFSNADWRKRPRRDRSAKRTARLSIRLTPAEYSAAEELSVKAGMTLSDYTVCRILRKRSRLTIDNDMLED